MIEKLSTWKYFQTSEEFGTDTFFDIDKVSICGIPTVKDSENKIIVVVQYDGDRSVTFPIQEIDSNYHLFSEDERDQILDDLQEEINKERALRRISKYEARAVGVSEEDQYIFFDDELTNKQIREIDLDYNCSNLKNGSYIKLGREDGRAITLNRWQDPIKDYDQSKKPYVNFSSDKDTIISVNSMVDMGDDIFFFMNDLECWICVQKEEFNNGKWFEFIEP